MQYCVVQVLLATYFTLASCLAYFSIVKTVEICSSELSLDFQRPAVTFVATAVRSAGPTKSWLPRSALTRGGLVSPHNRALDFCGQWSGKHRERESWDYIGQRLLSWAQIRSEAGSAAVAVSPNDTQSSATSYSVHDSSWNWRYLTMSVLKELWRYLVLVILMLRTQKESGRIWS
jgi:hypothetical protein